MGDKVGDERVHYDILASPLHVTRIISYVK